MTPSEIETAARRKTNSAGSSFYSSEEIMGYIYQASLELARESFCIERVYSTTSVANQDEYSCPTNTIAIKRVTYDGNRLEPITFDEMDELRLFNQASSTTGTAKWYALFNETLYLLPTPSASSLTIEIFSYNEPQAVTSTSTLEVPSQFHMGIVDFVVAEMLNKDSKFNEAQVYLDRWLDTIGGAKKWQQRKKRGNRPAHVYDEGR